ncbi:MAG: helix-turn-helix domain-containing protein [Peptococcaceae bacterium]|nr:helix-turn-helix domain-containing protein [Peptococcaceae bacterium]
MAEATKSNSPLEQTLSMLGGKWKILILWQLQGGTLRFGELKKAIPGITPKILTQQLRELEGHHLITRCVYAQVPPKVEYSLTANGRTLQAILDSMFSWGKIQIED